ncbi:Wzz/FepE/Etk N-terminal domain-containing protein [Alphaproteobacteria bacterium]|nr:Wzz/FepE/Etk N-terminal domain-containing protein [Alphaproteobacteria bacterium]
MSELPNDEIDLVELFQVIWDGKWLIAGLSALIIAPAFAFLAFIYEPGKKASINLLPLSGVQMNLYSGLNSTLSAPVTADSFQDTFFREFYRRQTAREIISENDPRILEFDGTQNERAAEIANIVSDELSIEVPEAEVLAPTVISFVGDDELSAINILKEIIQGLDKQTISSEKTKIDNVRSTKQRELGFEILKTEIEIENIFEDYKTRIEARKVYLAEQLAIAKTIGIQDNGFSDLLSKGSITGISGQNSLPFYMRGSRAIAKELSLLEARSSSKEEALKHIGKYPELRAKLLALQTDPSLANLDKELANSPFANDEQSIMNYDIDSITVVSTQSKLLILILVSILAGIFATIFVMIRHFMLDRNTQTTQ